MPNEFLPKTATEYIGLVRQLAALIELGMDHMQTSTSSVEDKNRAVQHLSEAVETISQLRGDSNLFEAGRPDGLIAYQREMYDIENHLKSQLFNLKND